MIIDHYNFVTSTQLHFLFVLQLLLQHSEETLHVPPVAIQVTGATGLGKGTGTGATGFDAGAVGIGIGADGLSTGALGSSMGAAGMIAGWVGI